MEHTGESGEHAGERVQPSVGVEVEAYGGQAAAASNQLWS